jgi:glycosyltransferase involved in cell wall biosynthesis
LFQNYPNLEYILMDGGSSDKSLDIIKKYEQSLAFLQSKPDGGQAAALKSGFEICTGEILGWLNSDDRLCPGTLFRVADFFRNRKHISFVNGDVNYIDDTGRVVGRVYAIPVNLFLTKNLGVHGWPQQGVFWRRSSYEESGGIDPTMEFCMDRDLFIRMAKVGACRRFPGPPLADFRIHPKAKSTRLLDVAEQENRHLLNKYGSASSLQSSRILKFCWWLWCKPTNFRARLNRKFGWEW